MTGQLRGLRLAYRDVDRTPLLYVLKEMAAEEGLELAVDRVFESEAFEGGFLDGEIDLICEHLRFLFPARLAGHPTRLLASFQNESTDRLVAGPEVKGVDDLIGKTVALRATPSSRISALFWLKQLGIADRVEVVTVEDEEIGRWQQWRKVPGGEAVAAICSPLYLEPALEAGLHVLDVAGLAEVGPLFLAALGPFVEEHQAELSALIRASYRALFVFRTDAERTLSIMSGEPAALMKLDDAGLRRTYAELAGSYAERPIPTLEAISTTFALINEGYTPLDGLNPLMLWDLRFALELEEAGYYGRLTAEATAGR